MDSSVDRVVALPTGKGPKMFKSVLLATWGFLLAAFLVISGCATFWWSSDLMLWLIWMVGEEFALGAENVIRVEGGRKFLTNPGAMGAWTVPFLLLAVVQVASAITLVSLWYSQLRLRRRQEALVGDAHPTSSLDAKKPTGNE